jgi:hypothetical protein
LDKAKEKELGADSDYANNNYWRMPDQYSLDELKLE